MTALSLNSQSPGRLRVSLGYAAAAPLLAAVAACSGSPAPTSASLTPGPSTFASVQTTLPPNPGTSPPPTSTAPPTPPASTGRTLAISVTGKKVSPPPAVVNLAVGETLTLTITSDHDDQVHAHGFEVEMDLKAGQPTTMTLTGTAPGRYDIETHRVALTLLTVAVR